MSALLSVPLYLRRRMLH